MSSVNTPSQEEIESFLQQARKAIADENYSYYPRKKFLDLCAKLGRILDDDEIFDIINNLDHTNYFRGPTPDHDLTKTDVVWEFKSSLDNISLYIKVKIIELDDEKLHCFGFHEDEV